MSARSQRPADRPTQPAGSPAENAAQAAGPGRCTRVRPAPLLALALLACAWPALAAAAEPGPAGEPPPPPAAATGAWQRVQRSPINALALIRERQAARAAEAGETTPPALPRSGFVAERGGIAWQLEGGGRITVRRQHHTPMLFYRSAF